MSDTGGGEKAGAGGGGPNFHPPSGSGEVVDYGKLLMNNLLVYFIIEGQVGYVLPRYDN